MVYQKPKRGPDHRETLAALVNRHLAERGWSPARLVAESGLSKATISRITNYRKAYRPQVNAIQTLALALQLNEEETLALFDAAYPGFLVWRECIRKGIDLDEANEILYEEGLPTFPIGYE